jgi:hypothetical protein
MSMSTDEAATPEKLRFVDVQQRVSSHVYTLYMNYAFLIKNGVFTVAALALYHLLIQPELSVVRLVFWGASFSFALVTMSTWSRGAILEAGRTSMFDVVIPIGMSIPEYLFFITVDPNYSGDSARSADGQWMTWYLWFALHALFAWTLITNRLVQTVEADYSEELKPLVRQHTRWMRRDRIGAGVAALIAFFVYFLTTKPAASIPFNFLQSPHAQIYNEVIGVFLIFFGLFLTWQAHEQYKLIQRFRPAPQMRDAGQVVSRSLEPSLVDVHKDDSGERAEKKENR